MPTTAVAPPSVAAVDDRSLIASDSEEYEYEEVEIEEEIEVEEEVSDDDIEEEEEEEEEEEGDGEDLSRSIEDGDDDKINLLHDQSSILKEKTTMISGDEKSPQCDGGIMTVETINPVNESSKQVTASDNVPLSEEQTTQVNTKDVNDAQQTELRLDVDVPLIRPRRLSLAMETKEGNKRPALTCVTEGTRSDMAVSAARIVPCSSEIKSRSQKDTPATNSSFDDMDKDNPPVNAVNSLHDQSVILATKTTMISNDNKSPQCDGGIITADTTNPVNESSKQVNASDKVPHKNDSTKSLSKKRKKRSKGRKVLFSDSGLSSGEGAGPDPSTTDDVCHDILHHTVPPGEIRSSQQVTGMHVSDRAGCLMAQAMGSVSQLIRCYDKKVETEKRLRKRIKRYRARVTEQAEENLKNAKRLKEAFRMVAAKEAEHKKEVYDLMEKLDKAYKENVQLERENVRIVNCLQWKMNQVGELIDERLVHQGALETVCERQPSADETQNASG